MVVFAKGALVVAGAVLVLELGTVAASPPHPHIVLIVTDDLGWDDVGFRSNQIKTPNIDSLAAGGRVLNHYYVQDVCSPSRAGFQTGRYPLHTTVNDWLRTTGNLPVNETLLPQKLEAAGYESHAIGKWHLGAPTWEHTPTFRGYSSFYGFYGGGQDYFTHGGDKALDFHLEIGERCGLNCSQPQFEAIGQYSTTLFTSRAVKVVGDHDPAVPLFLYLAYQAVHSPSEVPSAYSDRYDGGPPYNTKITDSHRKIFAGMLTCMDEGIGNVTAALSAKDMLDDTLIIFTSDNGGPTTHTPGGDYVGARNYPLRGGKHSIWEGGTRVTALVWAGSSTQLMDKALVGTPVNDLMHGVDWLSTFCAVAGLTDCGAHGLPLDGIDMSGPIFHNTSGGHDYILYGQHDDAPNTYQPYDDAIRDAAGWKLIQGTGGKPDDWSQPVNSTIDDTPNEVCTTPNCFADPLLSLYDLDPAAMELSVTCSTPSEWQKACYPASDIAECEVSTPADCCAACSELAGCVGWTFNEESSGNNCFQKSGLGKSKAGNCTSGGAISPEPPQNRALLFNVVVDPGEHQDVFKENPTIVARLAAKLNEMRATEVTRGDRLECGTDQTVTTPQGTYLVPYCNVTG